MERVCLALDLGQPRNRDDAGSRGWMNLLRRWAAAPSFRHVYLMLISSYSTGFQHFCKHALGIAVDYVWTSIDAVPAPTPLDVAAFAPASPSAIGPAERLLLSIHESGGAGIPIGEAAVHYRSAGPPLSSFTLRPGFDSSDLRRVARHRLDRFLAARAPGLVAPAGAAPRTAALPAVTPASPTPAPPDSVG
jgi:hypothetical protein